MRTALVVMNVCVDVRRMKIIDLGYGIKIKDYWSDKKLGLLTVLFPIITPKTIYNLKTLGRSNLYFQCQCECGQLREYEIEKLRKHYNKKYGFGCRECRILEHKVKIDEKKYVSRSI